MDRKTSLFLHPGAFYRMINGKIIMYYTPQAMLYTFNESAGDILDCLKTGSTINDMLCSLGEKYQIQDTSHAAFQDVEEFVDALVNDGIVIARSRANDYSGVLENEVSDEYANSQRLYSATIELTYKCNEKCRHCYVSDEGGKELTTSQIKRVLDELYDIGVLTILFTGGEVFVRQDFFEILEYAYEKRFAVDIFTNGTLLDADRILRLKAFWPKGIHFSVYSHIAEKHDAVTQISGSYEKTIKAIKACRLVGIPVKIKMPVFTETVDDISGVISLAESLGTSISVSNDITPKKNGDITPLGMRVISSDEYGDVAHAIENKLGNLYIPEKRDRKLSNRICSAGARMISINPYGKVFPCVCFPISIGDVTKQSLRDIWINSKELNTWRQQNKMANRTDCIKCAHLEYCRFCPGEAIMYNGNPVLKYQDACYVTECKKRHISSEVLDENTKRGGEKHEAI